MSKQLRPYQEKIIEDVREAFRAGHNSVLVQLATGGGKTLTTATMIKRALGKGNRAWFLCHRKELVNQSSETFNGLDIPHGFIAAGSYPNPLKPVQICSIQTLARRVSRMKAPPLFIIDECFPAGTQVDGVPIESIKVGDFVTSVDKNLNVSKRKVIRVFKKTPKTLLKLKVGVTSVLCTEEHPFYVGWKGWVKAKDLTIGDMMLTITPYERLSELRSMREPEPTRAENLLTSLSLQGVVSNNAENQYSMGSARKKQGKDEEEKPYALVSSEGDCFHPLKGHETQAKNTRWKWKTITCSASCSFDGSWLGNGNGSTYRDVKRFWHPTMLQVGYWKRFVKNWDRNRWKISSSIREATAGQEKRPVLDWSRLESVEVQERTGDGRFGGLCPDGFVYNFEVEKNHTYFANGVLAHNCQHCAATQWALVHKTLTDAGAKCIGLSATPERLDGKGLGKYFSHMVQGPSVAWLIEEGYLSPYKIFAPSSVDTSSIHTRMGDFVKDELNDLMDNSTITGDAISHYAKHASGKKAIVFCVSIRHSQHVVENFNANGFPAAHADGEMDGTERAQKTVDFKSGGVNILSNVELFGEGYDVPDVETVILLRPTQSLTIYLQQVGRGLRPVYAPGYDLSTKEGRKAAIAAGPKPYCIILDHAGNCLRHGLPDDDREWSLEDRVKKRGGKKDTSPSVRQCPKCYHIQKSIHQVCQECGHKFEVEAREIKQVDGELKEMTRENMAVIKKKEQAASKTLEDLIKLGKMRGYNNPAAWAGYVYNARKR